MKYEEEMIIMKMMNDNEMIMIMKMKWKENGEEMKIILIMKMIMKIIIEKEI